MRNCTNMSFFDLNQLFGRNITIKLLIILFFVFASKAYAAPPDAVDDAFSIAHGATLSDFLSANDLGLDGPLDTYSKATEPANGSASVSSDGSFTYTPNVGFAGVDSFTYTIDDGAGGSDTATVEITVASSSDFLSVANDELITAEDTAVHLGISVVPDLFNGGALLDIISTASLFRSESAGASPTVVAIPAKTSSIVVTGFSTQVLNTAGNDNVDDDYQLLNARIDLINGVSSGRVAFLNHGRLTELDQYSWEQVSLGQSVLSDNSKVIGYHAKEASDPLFKVVGGDLHIIETHSLETAYHVEFMTSDGDSTNFIKAGNSVQNAGQSVSALALPPELEPASGKKGFVILNAISAAAGNDFQVEHKGFNRFVVDLETGIVSGIIAAQQGESSNNTVTYGFENYPLIDQRIGGSPGSITTNSGSIVGDTIAKGSVRDDPQVYINASGELVIGRSADFSNTYTSMYTAEFYERTGFSSIASFVSVGSDDALFDASPVDAVDENGKSIDELLFSIPASAKVGIMNISWNTIGGSDTNENIGMGFAIVDLDKGTSSGSITFIRTSTPDLLSWDGVTYGQTFFGATDATGASLYQSNKNAGGFTDRFVETAQLDILSHPDGSRSLKLSAFSNAGTQDYRDYRANAHVSWLGNEPFEIEGLSANDTFTHGSPTPSGNWEIDFTELSLVSYIPDEHASGVVDLKFVFSSTKETENIRVYVEPVADPVTLTIADTFTYTNVTQNISASLVDSADTDGSETQIQTLQFSGVPASVTLSATAGSVVDLGSGNWTVSATALATLTATGTTAVSATVDVTGSNIDTDDIDGDGSIEDGNNGIGVDEEDELIVNESFVLTINDVPTVTNLLVNNGTPVISGTASTGPGQSLSVQVNGITYTAGDGNLVDNGDGTWDLTIPSANSLPENTYMVEAVLSHTQGSSATDLTTNELIVDLTPPPAPGVTSQVTSDTTPVISGTTTVGTGLTLKVEVNGELYTAGDGNLVDNGDGTWDLTIPSVDALPEALYQVVATLTDAAGNVATDPGVDELLVDITAPPAPGVTSLVTNDTTPTITGTATLIAGDTLTVTVNTETYTAGDGNLVDNGDGTWELTIPTADLLAENTYDVTATITDLATNTSTDPSSSELIVDLTAPVAPTVTSQITNDDTPLISGTATVNAGEILTVVVNSATYIAGDGNLVDNGDGTWDLIIPTIETLLEGVYEVTATVTDAAGNATADATTDELIVDLTPPVIPTVTFQLTNIDTPLISGTAIVGANDTLEVVVNGVTYTTTGSDLVDNGNGTWDLAIPAGDALTDGTYDVITSVTDIAGNVAIDATTNDLIVDLTPPPAPGVTSQVTSDTTPVISGTTTVGTGLTLKVEVNGELYTAGDGNLVDNGDGTWDLTIPSVDALPEALYQVVATLTDAAGNVSTDPGVDELLVDITAPPAPGVTSLVTNDTTPTITGTATLIAGDTLTVTVNTETYTAGDGNLIDNGDGTWELTIPTADLLAENTYDVTATITDLATNTSTDPSSSELIVDLTAPVAPTVTSQITNDDTPLISGTATVNTGEILSVTVNNVTYTAGDGNLVDNGNSTWDLTIPANESLAENTYEVIVTVTDAAGNTASDASLDELIVDLTPPVIPTVTFQLTNINTPLISGTATVGATDTLNVVVNGVTYSTTGSHLVDNGNGTWDLTIPASDALTDGTYDVITSVTDIASNVAIDATTNDLIVDLTPPPAPGVTSQVTSDTTPVISGTTTVGTGLTLKVEVNGELYTAGDGNLVDNGDGTWDLTIPSVDALPEALYQVVATLTDAAGNVATDPGVDELLVDITAPPAPGVTSLVTNDTTPTIIGTATLVAGDTLTVTVNTETYTAGDGNLVDNGDGTWELTIPTADLLGENTYDVTATITDLATNTSTDPSSSELIVDLTAPAAPAVNSLITNNVTPVISGTATVNTGEILSVTVNNVTYTAGDGNLIDNGNSTWDLTIPVNESLPENTYEVIVTVTDAAGNEAADASLDELIVDLTPPVTPTVIFQLTNDNTPTISGTATVGANDTLEVVVNGVTYSTTGSDLIDNGNGTWDLTIPASDALTDGTYDVITTVTDIAGNSAIDATTSDLIVDLTPPPAPGVTSQVTSDTTPVISGTTTVGTGLTLKVEVNGELYTEGDGNLVDNGDGTWDLTIPTIDALPEALYQVIATLTDAAGNVSTDPGVDELLVDITAPPAPGVTSLVTNDTTPTITGTATLVAGDTLTVTVNTETYTAGDGNLVDNGDGTWELTIPTADTLAENTYDVTATITDLATNTSTDPSSSELIVDLTAPAAPTVTSQITNDDTPLISGTATVNAGEILTVVINSATYIAGDGNLVDNGDGTWDLIIPTIETLLEGVYEVAATVTDAATNATSDATTSELIVDLTPPLAVTVVITDDINDDALLSAAEYDAMSNIEITLPNDAVSGDVLDVSDGISPIMLTLSSADIGNGNVQTVFATPLDGSLMTVTATITDSAGNTSTQDTDEALIDLVPPSSPTLTIAEDGNNDGFINIAELLGVVDIQVALPVDASVGDQLDITINGLVSSITLSNVHISAGIYNTSIAAPTDGASIVASASLTDIAGNTSIAANDSAILDLTVPTLPSVIAQITNTGEPTITGFATINAGDSLLVTVDGTTYTEGDGNLVNNNDGTWTLTIPASQSIAEGIYSVTTTVTDPAGNPSLDITTDELQIDLTPPAAPTVTAQITNDTTPIITGTAVVGTNDVLTVTVDGVTYNSGDGYLLDNGDGSWELSIPATDSLLEAVYDVTASVTDEAGNATNDASTDELIIDLTPPAIPTVTFQLTNSGTPTIEGTAVVTSTDVLTVVVNSATYTVGDGNLVDNGDGTWNLTIPTIETLTEATYDVVVAVTDNANNTSIDVNVADLVVDLTPPPAPGVTSQVTSDTTPTIEGTTTIGNGLTLTVSVNGDSYTVGDGNLVDNGDGTWTLTIPPANTLPEALYQVVAMLSDAAGNVATDPTTDDLLVDTTAPSAPGVTGLTTNDTTPVISGTATLASGELLTVEVNGVIYTQGDGNLVINSDNTWSLSIPVIDTLAEATYNVTATITDAAQNISTDPSSTELLIDITAPMAPTVIDLVTNNPTPMLSGTAIVNSGETLSVIVNSATYTAGDGNLVDNGDATWSLMIPPIETLLEGTYEVTAIVSDAAGNTTADASSNELIVDLTAPATPTVTGLLTNSGSPVLVGTATIGSDEILTVSVNNIVYTAGDGNLSDNGDGTWTLTIPAVNALAENTYEVSVTTTDPAGNSSSDTTGDELIIDLTAPAIPTVTAQITNNLTPTIIGSATLASDELFMVEVNGETYLPGDGNLALTAGGNWTLTIPAANSLPEALYQVTATITDAAGNSNVDVTEDDLTIDVTGPIAPGVTSQTTSDTTPVISGTTIIGGGLTLQVTVNNIIYTAGDGQLVDNGDGTWDLTVPSSDALPEALYQVIATHIDAAGNSTLDTGIDELLVDTTAPAAPGVTSQVTNDSTPTIYGTATVGVNETLMVEVDGTTYLAGDGNLVDVGDGTWHLTIPSGSELAEAIYDVTATIIDTASNSSSDPSSSELKVDLTAPVTPTAASQLTNSSNPTIGGMATVGPGETLTVTINGVTYTAGDGDLVDHGDGTWSLIIPSAYFLPDGSYDVLVEVTDPAGNLSSNGSSQTITVDTEPPMITAATINDTHTRRPLLGGTTDRPDGSDVTVHNDLGDTICVATVIAGAWECTATIDLPYGDIPLTATVSDAAGNTASDNFSATISDDYDGDGIPNELESSGDSDGDGVIDAIDLDSDNDGISDAIEGLQDTDNDGIVDALDLDSDNDGIADTFELLGIDSDQNYLVDNFIDSNNNGLSDSLENANSMIPDTDFDAIPDYLDLDSDQDGVPDIVEAGGTDSNNDGRIDDFLDANDDGIDDGIYVAPLEIANTDLEGNADFRDIDSDNDLALDVIEAGGIDLNSDGVVDSANDIDRDSIPDSVDVDQTGGLDVDEDGIDDRFDASFLADGDMDNDGIADPYDPDANGDGYVDDQQNNLALGAALPDEDNNGEPDIYQASSGPLKVGLDGRGGCTIQIHSGSVAKTTLDPTLPLLVLFAMLYFLRGRAVCGIGRLRKYLIVTSVVGSLLWMPALLTAEEFDRRFYLSGGSGGTYLSPDDSESTTKVTSNTSSGTNLSIGTDLTRRFSLELQLANLGSAGLSSEREIDYESYNMSGILYGGPRRSRSRRQGLTFFGRLGLGQLRNQSDAEYIRENDVHLLFGGGLEYGLSSLLAARAEVISYDTDAHYAGIQLLLRFGIRSQKAKEPIFAAAVIEPDSTKIKNASVETVDRDVVFDEVPQVDPIIIYFDVDKHTVIFRGINRLRSLVSQLNELDQYLLQVAGYADPTGAADYNLKLSGKRASEVKQRLVQLGIPSRTIEVIAKGETDEFGPTDTDSGLAKNRRVVVSVSPMISSPK